MKNKIRINILNIFIDTLTEISQIIGSEKVIKITLKKESIDRLLSQTLMIQKKFTAPKHH